MHTARSWDKKSGRSSRWMVIRPLSPHFIKRKFITEGFAYFSPFLSMDSHPFIEVGSSHGLSLDSLTVLD